MKTILFHYPDLDNNRVFNQHIFGFNEPIIYLKEKLNSLGYGFKTSDKNSLVDCEWVIFFNAPLSELLPQSGLKNKLKKYKFLLLGKNKENARDLYKECIEIGFNKIALILWEGKAVIPENYSKKLHDKFPVIFTWNDDLVDNVKFFKFYHPIAKLPEASKIPYEKKKLLVNISMNKFSSHPQELYSARLKSIRYFEKNYPDNFDLFGIRWNEPKNRLQKLFPFLVENHPCYRGKIDRKIDVLPNYKFSLCYENLADEKGYVSEKIFDCIRCGTVPIYWGASNIADFVDTDAFIDRRQFKSDKELADFIVNIGEEEYNKYIVAAESYLKSEKFNLFSSENFVETIIKTLIKIY